MMAVHKMKLFTGSDLGNIEADVNKFLQEKPQNKTRDFVRSEMSAVYLPSLTPSSPSIDPPKVGIVISLWFNEVDA